MRENRTYGSEGGGAGNSTGSSYPYPRADAGRYPRRAYAAAKRCAQNAQKSRSKGLNPIRSSTHSVAGYE